MTKGSSWLILPVAAQAGLETDQERFQGCHTIEKDDGGATVGSMVDATSQHAAGKSALVNARFRQHFRRQPFSGAFRDQSVPQAAGDE
jgi:hypothetical protein